MVPILLAALVVIGGPTVYCAVRSKEFRKFLAGAFFVSGGIQFYLYLANVSVPLLGTTFVQTPELSVKRSILHFIFFVITFYFGFISTKISARPSRRSSRPPAPFVGGGLGTTRINGRQALTVAIELHP
jgi:hypothetical protein